VAQFGGVPWAALAADGERVHDRAPVRVTAHALGGRVAAAFEGHRRSRAGPPAGALQRGMGRGLAVRRRSECWSPLSRIPRRCRRPEGTIPSGRYQAGSHAAVVAKRPAGHRPAGLVVQAPPTATGDPGQPHLWEVFPRLMPPSSPQRVLAKWTPFTPQVVLSRIPRRVGGRSQAGRAGGVTPGVSAGQRQ